MSDDQPREPAWLARGGPVWPFAFAAGSVALALVVTYFVKPLREQPPALLFFTAVILTSWYGGMRAGLCASMLSIVALNFVFVAGQLNFEIEFVDLVDFIAFAGVAWFTSFTQNRWRKAHRSLVVVEEEMHLAREIQQRMFPANAPDLPGFDIAGGCFPAKATGGDFFDYIPMADNGVGICIGDVSSHGVGPALVMSLIRAYLRALSRAQTDPGVVLSETNDIVCDDIEEGRFATVFLCRLEPHRHSMVYAGAGHESYLLHGSGESTVLESTGLPLGLVRDRLIGSAPEAIAGKLEIRGLGIVELQYQVESELSLAVTLTPEIERMPVAAEQACDIYGVRLSAVSIEPESPSAPARIRAALGHLVER